jgi:rare lipoprotein A
MRYIGVLLALIACVWLVSCSGKSSKPAEPSDGPSTSDIKASDVKDAVPRDEPLARYGNHSPYEVFGKKYTVMKSSKGYHKKGTASWYGSKFHGRRTSSGEPYDMHLATAAHKSLPLPTYAEVTNLDNGKKVIVKINDRGPFKHDRLIDMSYGAALRLGMTGTGTARVDVRVIDGSSGEYVADRTAPVADSDGTMLQAGAFGKREGAEKLADQLERARLKPVTINDSDNLFRVWLGPYDSAAEVESVISRAIELGFERPHTVKR